MTYTPQNKLKSYSAFWKVFQFLEHYLKNYFLIAFYNLNIFYCILFFNLLLKENY